jgi:hypothetical protein
MGEGVRLASSLSPRDPPGQPRFPRPQPAFRAELGKRLADLHALDRMARWAISLRRQGSWLK